MKRQMTLTTVKGDRILQNHEIFTNALRKAKIDRDESKHGHYRYTDIRTYLTAMSIQRAIERPVNRQDKTMTIQYYSG